MAARIDTRFSPSALANYLACPHLTTLELAVRRGELERPFRVNRHAELIRDKGQEHEDAYLASLGDDVVLIDKPWEIGWEVAAAATAQAMRDGAPVIYQATFVDGSWRGLSDFVERQPDGSYEVSDTKLARHSKPYFLLQLSFYSEQLGRVQGRLPERVRARFLEFVESSPETYPLPVSHCQICAWRAGCE